MCKFFVELSIRKTNIRCPFEKHELQDNNCNITKNCTHIVLFLNYLFFCSLKCSYGFIPIVNFAKGYIICMQKFILFENFATFPVPVPRFAL